jgi:hypothetical protein
MCGGRSGCVRPCPVDSESYALDGYESGTSHVTSEQSSRNSEMGEGATCLTA